MAKAKTRSSKTRNNSRSRAKRIQRTTNIKLGKYKTKWIKVYGDIGNGKGPIYLFSTKTEIRDILPGLEIHGLGMVRYSYEKKDNDKTKSTGN